MLSSLRLPAAAAALALSMACSGFDGTAPPRCTSSSDWAASVRPVGTWWSPGVGLELEVALQAWTDVDLGGPDITGGTREDGDARDLFVAVDADEVTLTYDAACADDARVLTVTAVVPEIPREGSEAVLTTAWSR